MEAKIEIKLTKENYIEVSKNENVLNLIASLLDKGDNLTVSNYPVGSYVCSCNKGVVQRIK